MGETTFAIVFFCACVLFLSAVGYFAFGILAKFYAFIKFAVRFCLQEPKFSLAVFAPAFILSLYIALVSQNLVLILLGVPRQMFSAGQLPGCF
ncbi:hypothetical protein [Campylobacter showae]|uniref:Uncharacterized protein n=1 Tax=Campylobacter showae CSUNSWCD TaxID=1244083 RepID=M5IRJ9_9BACT|nr:hypothetical protein [Campylobacter showae]EKU11178.1 hypothetical protein CSUNSWCD_2301 [Campylobacter showae CSUNSWCD]